MTDNNYPQHIEPQSDKLLILQQKTVSLYNRFEKAIEDHRILRFYTNGIIIEFRKLVDRILEMWDGVDGEMFGQNVDQIKDMVKSQLGVFNVSMPQETSFESIKEELDKLEKEFNEKMKAFEKRILELSEPDHKMNYREQYNADLEMEINKAYLADKQSRTFLSKLSNEVLSPIQMFLSMSKNMSFGNMDLSGEPVFTEISGAAQKFTHLLNEYKAFQEIRENFSSLKSEDFDFEEALNEILEKYTEDMLDDGYDLFYKIDRELPGRLQARKVLFTTLIKALLDNAINILRLSQPLTEREGGKVNLKVDVLRKENWRSQLQIAVEDTGVGFPTESMKDVFSFFSLYSEQDPFASLKVKMIQDLLEMLGGELCLTHSNDKTAFTITLGVDLP